MFGHRPSPPTAAATAAAAAAAGGSDDQPARCMTELDYPPSASKQLPLALASEETDDDG